MSFWEYVIRILVFKIWFQQDMLLTIQSYFTFLNKLENLTEMKKCILKKIFLHFFEYLI